MNFIFYKEITPERSKDISGEYEDKLLLLFLLCGGIWTLVYSRFNFLIPLNLEQCYGEQGAVWFGTLTSVNAVVVLGLSAYTVVQDALPVYFISMIVFTIGEICETLG